MLCIQKRIVNVIKLSIGYYLVHQEDEMDWTFNKLMEDQKCLQLVKRKITWETEALMV